MEDKCKELMAKVRFTSFSFPHLTVLSQNIKTGWCQYCVCDVVLCVKCLCGFGSKLKHYILNFDKFVVPCA